MAVYLWTFLISYLILFVVCYIVVEYGHDYFYGEVPPGRGLRVALGTLILAAMLTWTRSNFATMFTSDIIYTVPQAIVWTGVFLFIFRFHPWHGFGLALATMLIFTGAITIAVDSLLAPKLTQRYNAQTTVTPPRRRTFGAPTRVVPDVKPAAK